MIVDCNTIFGYWQKELHDYSLPTLLRLMRRHGIERALTCSARGVWDSFLEGNEETIRVCAAHPQLFPVATIRPSDWHACREEIASLRARGFRMIRFFPAVQGWSVSSLSFRRLVEPLVACGLPLFFDNDYNIAAVMSPLVEMFQGTNVPLIFSGVSYSLSEFLAACERHPFCYTDTWQLFLLNEIEIIRNEAGAGHVLYGSRAPRDMPGPCLEMIRHARLGEDERKQILGEGILALLGLSAASFEKSRPAAAAKPKTAPVAASDGVRAPAVPPQAAPEAEAPGPKAPWRPKAPYEPVIDVHAHYGMWPGLPNPFTSGAALMDTCRRFRMAHCCLSSTLAINYDMQEGNRRLAEWLARLPARAAAAADAQAEPPDAALAPEDAFLPQFHGYVVIHPGYPAESLAQLREYLCCPHFVGAKLHPKHCGFMADAPQAWPLLEYLTQQKKPLLVHTWFDEMCEAMGHAAQAFPELLLIMGHMGGDTWETALRVAAERPNLYLELCSGLSPRGKLEKAVQIVGAERILFGSDVTLLDPGYTLGFVTGAEIGERERRLILYDNARQLFGF